MCSVGLYSHQGRSLSRGGCFWYYLCFCSELWPGKAAEPGST